MRRLTVTKNLKELKSEETWGELESKNVSKDNKLQNIWDLLYFSSEITHNEKSLISVFQEFFAIINKNFIFAGRLDTRLWFYEV